MESAATGDAARAVREALEYRPASGVIPGLNAECEALRERIPGADIWYVQRYHGQVQWIARLEGDSPRHLLEGLRDAGKDAEAVL